MPGIIINDVLPSAVLPHHADLAGVPLVRWPMVSPVFVSKTRWIARAYSTDTA